jgi:hypothetical protein
LIIQQGYQERDKMAESNGKLTALQLFLKATPIIIILGSGLVAWTIAQEDIKDNKEDIDDCNQELSEIHNILEKVIRNEERYIILQRDIEYIRKLLEKR